MMGGDNVFHIRMTRVKAIGINVSLTKQLIKCQSPKVLVTSAT